MSEILEHTSPGILVRFFAPGERRSDCPAHLDIIMTGAFKGLAARNIQRALRLEEGNREYVEIELVLRRRIL